MLAQLQAEGKSDGYVDEEIGECLLLAADSWLAKNEAVRLARLRELSEEQN